MSFSNEKKFAVKNITEKVSLEQYFFVFIAFSLSPFGLSGTFAVGSLFFPYVRRGSGVLSLATHAHPLFSFFLPGQHNTNTTIWEAHPAWDSNSADLAVVSGECRSSLHHFTVTALKDIHTHPWPGGGSFLGKKSSRFGEFRTHLRRDRDLGALSPTAMRPPSYPLEQYLNSCKNKYCGDENFIYLFLN
jgi:hypothetical protein